MSRLTEVINKMSEVYYSFRNLSWDSAIYKYNKNVGVSLGCSKISKLDKAINEIKKSWNSAIYSAIYSASNSARYSVSNPAMYSAWESVVGYSIRDSAWESVWGSSIYSARYSASSSSKYKDNKNVEVFLKVLKDE